MKRLADLGNVVHNLIVPLQDFDELFLDVLGRDIVGVLVNQVRRLDGDKCTFPDITHKVECIGTNLVSLIHCTLLISARRDLAQDATQF